MDWTQLEAGLDQLPGVLYKGGPPKGLILHGSLHLLFYLPGQGRSDVGGGAAESRHQA